MTEIVPFGKYKGQPVEVLAADRDYCEWLTAQPWFQAKYSTVYNILINYGTEPQDSPEHNEMQARFLDDDWCLSLFRILTSPSEPLHLALAGPSEDIRAILEKEGWDDLADLAPRKRFEVDGWDVVIGLPWWTRSYLRPGEIHQHWAQVSAELKPDLGDDYPSVLRQVTRYEPHGVMCVIARRHAFQSVTWEQVQKIFAASKITLLAEDQISATLGR